MTEVWDAYDENRNLIPGKTIIRETFSTADDFHLVVEVLLLHGDNAVLFMHRSSEKETFPGYYEATAGGSALKGENSETAVRRELKEETGLEADRLQLLYQYSDPKYHAHFDHYLARTGADKDQVSYQKGETDGHVWVSPEELADFLDKEDVLPANVTELKILFGLK
ncbi:NUDIX hydrolase [Streptococcus orisasini]|uniref:NUDIX hydrolase n=1 Tax=Streptococcus orisasini TaxID=1080071 RepID=UPI000708F0FC|nr:NUDIX domain-containing protein [Streptococcus orisasini]